METEKRLTKRRVDALPIPSALAPGKTAQARYYDKGKESITGFGVRVTRTSTGKVAKVFFVERRLKKGGPQHRITIGRYPGMSVEQARDEAEIYIGEMTRGINPTDSRKAKDNESTTLKKAFEAFLEERKLNQKTRRDYENVMNSALSDWKRRRLDSITGTMVKNKHKRLTDNNGAVYANLSMRTFRSVFNFAIAKYGHLTDNPVKALNKERKWNAEPERVNILGPEQFQPWYEAVQALENETIRDYLTLLLFTGLRKNEAAGLSWDCVDLTGRTFTIPETKNHKPHTLPLSDFLLELLTRRKKYATGNYVFPGRGKTGHLVEPKKVVAKIIKSSGVQFIIHDLRRTFITVAANQNISVYQLKALVNHRTKRKQADVTTGYVQISIEQLREPMDLITNYLLSATRVKTGNNVVPFAKAQ